VFFRLFTDISKIKPRKAILAVILGLSAVSSYAKADTVDGLRSFGFGMPAATDTGPYEDINPSDNPFVANNPVIQNIYDSTIMIVTTDNGWNMIDAGCATFIKNTNLNGFPVAVSVRHGVDMQINAVPDGHLVMIDHEGDVLGVAYTIKQNYKYSDAYGDTDYPMLIGVDPNYPLDRKALAKIKGVAIAKHLPPGFITGRTTGIGTAEGASGGGWYNSDGEMVGVIEGFQNVSPLDSVPSLHVASVNPFISGITRQVETPDTRIIETSTFSYIQSLYDSQLLSQINSVTDSDEVVDYKNNGMDYSNSFGFGFPGLIAALFKGNLTYNEKLDSKFAYAQPGMMTEAALISQKVEQRMQTNPTMDDQKERYLIETSVAYITYEQQVKP
jgi:hypothetical protein